MFPPRGIVYLLVWLTLQHCLVNGDKRSYNNYAAYRVTPMSLQTLDVIGNLENSPNDYVFLDITRQVGNKIDVLVAPNAKAAFLEKVLNEDIAHELLELNLQNIFEGEEIADPYIRTNEYVWNKYHTLNDTYEWLQNLARQFEGTVDIFNAGYSYEKRDIMGIKISFANGESKRAIFIEGGMHAREWISPATSTYIANEILNNKDENVRKIVENFDWYIVPHTNPDGFEYTHTTDRLWRKTRTPYGNNCFGADPNRNWDYHWNEVGASSNPCSDTYAGPAAFSEIETRSLAKYLDTLKNDIFLYISFHAYSQLLLFPYGYTGERPANYGALKRIYDVTIQKLSERYGTQYTGGNIYDAIYPASGSTVDYAYGALNINYAYCYELRPSSRQFWTGFKLPANQIIPTGQETFDSLLAMVLAADKISQTNIK